MTVAKLAASLASLTCVVAWTKVAAMRPMGPKVQRRCSLVEVSSSLLSMTHLEAPAPVGRTDASAALVLACEGWCGVPGGDTCWLGLAGMPTLLQVLVGDANAAVEKYRQLMRERMMCQLYLRWDGMLYVSPFRS